MAGYIGSKAVSVNTTSATISDDLTVGDDATIAGTLGVTGVLTATSLDISGDIDVDGTTNLDVVDIDGAVNMATTLLVTGNVDFNGDLDVDGTTNLDATNIVGGTDINGTVTISPNTSGKDTFQFSTNASNEARLRMKNVDTTTVQIRAGGDSYFNGGDVFVGKTAASNTAVGLMLAGTQGQLNSVTTDAGGAQQNIFLNRQDSDGNFILFRKANATVGSIKTSSGALEIDGGSGYTGLHFATSIIAPRDNGSLNDGGVGLGNANYRFSDLYLSGGVFLGGTGAANKISDYEEGTFNATITCGDGSSHGTISLTNGGNGAYYTKVGRLVTIGGRLDVESVSSPTNQLYITNLPFTFLNDHDTAGLSAVTVAIFSPSTNIEFNLCGEMTATHTTSILLRDNMGYTGGVQAIADHIDAGSFIVFSATYVAA